jgi:hypothetical protein
MFGDKLGINSSPLAKQRHPWSVFKSTFSHRTHPEPTCRSLDIWRSKPDNHPLMFVAVVSMALLVSCAGRSPELSSDDVKTTYQIAMDAPLTKFGQELTGDQRTLILKPGETTKIRVTIRNLTNAIIATAGKYPVTLSYKWFDNGQMLPIEGARTFLVRPLAINEQETVFANVTAPESGTNLTLRFSLVQEGVAWFFLQNAPTLDISVQIQQ